MEDDNVKHCIPNIFQSPQDDDKLGAKSRPQLSTERWTGAPAVMNSGVRSVDPIELQIRYLHAANNTSTNTPDGHTVLLGTSYNESLEGFRL